MKNWGGRIIILTVSIIPTQDEPDFCKSSASTVSTGSEPGPVLGVLGGAEPLERSGLRPSAEWVQGSAPSDGARAFQSIGLIWKLCLQKRKTSRQQSAALGWMSLSLQLLLIREPSSSLAYLSPSDTLLDVDGCVCSFYLLSLNLPFPSFSQYSFKAVSPQPTPHSLTQHGSNQPCCCQGIHTPQSLAPSWTALTGPYHKITCTDLGPGAFSAFFFLHC